MPPTIVQSEKIEDSLFEKKPSDFAIEEVPITDLLMIPKIDQELIPPVPPQTKEVSKAQSSEEES
jgi:hypothetical protein